MATVPLVGHVVSARFATPGETKQFPRPFAAGQTVRGVVLRALPEGQTLVNFGGQYVMLALDQPMARGQTFTAMVEQASPTLLLKIVEEPAAYPTGTMGRQTPPAVSSDTPGMLNAIQLKSYLVAKQSFADTVAALQHHLTQNPSLRRLDAALHHRLAETLRTLLSQESPPLDAAGLKTQLDRSGINYEAKVAHLLTHNAAPAEQATLMQDLKGQLLELLRLVDQLPAPEADTAALRQQVQQALQNIEFQQLANVFAQQEDEFLLLQFIHPAFPASHTAKVFFRADSQPERKQGTATQGYTLVFLLDFTALGNVRIDAVIRGSQVSATIRTEDEAVAQFVASQASPLTDRLRQLGFQTEISCCAQKTVSLDVDDALTRLLTVDPSHLVDVKA